MSESRFWSSAVRPGLRRLAVAAAALLAPIAAFQLWDYLEVRALADEVRLVQATGEPLDERAAPGAFPFAEAGPESAGQFYLAAGVLALGSGAGQALAPLRDWARDPGGPGEQLEAALAPTRAAVAQAGDALALLDRAGRLPYSGMPAGTEFSYRVAGLAALQSLAAARAVSESARGDGDDAVTAALDLLRLRLPLRDLAKGLVWHEDVAGILLTLAPASEDRLAELQTAFAAEDRPRRAHDTYLGARARMFTTTATLHRLDAGTGQSRQVGVAAAVIRPFVARRVRRALARWRELLPLLGRPWSEQKAALERIRDHGAVVPYVGWANDQFRLAALDPTPALDRCAVAAIAVKRFALAHAGKLPDRLADLVPTYLTAVPRDPFGIGDLQYRAEASRYTVYSVGPDTVDDGGDLTSRQPPGALRQAGARGVDIGVRVALGLTRPSAPR